MTLNSNPTGAVVYLNGEEAGRTPCTVDFTWYGKYDVTLRKEGYKTLKTIQNVAAPWWQWVPFDLAAELTPGKKMDHKRYSYVMKPLEASDPSPQGLVQRAETLRPQLESGQFTRTPATRPASSTK